MDGGGKSGGRLDRDEWETIRKYKERYQVLEVGGWGSGETISNKERVDDRQIWMRIVRKKIRYLAKGGTIQCVAKGWVNIWWIMSCQELGYNSCLAHFCPKPGREKGDKTDFTARPNKFLSYLYRSVTHKCVFIEMSTANRNKYLSPHPHRTGIRKVEQHDKFPRGGSNFWERIALQTIGVPRQLPCPSDSPR